MAEWKSLLLYVEYSSDFEKYNKIIKIKIVENSIYDKIIVYNLFWF